MKKKLKAEKRVKKWISNKHVNMECFELICKYHSGLTDLSKKWSRYRIYE